MFEINITYSNWKRTGRKIGYSNSRCQWIAKIRSRFLHLPRDFVVRPYISGGKAEKLIQYKSCSGLHLSTLLLLFTRTQSPSSSDSLLKVETMFMPCVFVIRSIVCSSPAHFCSDAVKNLFSWSSLRSFPQISRRCYQVSNPCLLKKVCSKRFACRFLILLLSINFLPG